MSVQKLISLFVVAVAILSESEQCLAWSKLPLWRRRRGSSTSSSSLGGQHLVNAGKSLQTAADFVNFNNYAGPSLLRDAGESLQDIGQAWQEDNWEAVTYAAEDCSSSFFALSQLQRRPPLQRVYKTASGELNVVAATKSNHRNHAGKSFKALSKCLKEAAALSQELKEGRDSAAFCKSMREAAKSIKALANEQS